MLMCFLSLAGTHLSCSFCPGLAWFFSIASLYFSIRCLFPRAYTCMAFPSPLTCISLCLGLASSAPYQQTLREEELPFNCCLSLVAFTYAVVDCTEKMFRLADGVRCGTTPCAHLVKTGRIFANSYPYWYLMFFLWKRSH